MFETVPNMSRLVELYNDVENYPTLESVATGLGISIETLKSRISIHRHYQSIMDDRFLPKIHDEPSRSLNIESSSSSTVDSNSNIQAEDKISPAEHASHRANSLDAELRHLLQSSKYPVINPEALQVSWSTRRVYKPALREWGESASVPRIWVSDVMRVSRVREAHRRRFIFTGAQNDAPVHKGFWGNLRAFAKHVGAEIVVGPWTYETAWWNESNAVSRYFDPEIAEHLCFGQMEIGDNFVFCGESNILPTSSTPLAGLASYSRGKWAVFPHARLQLESVPSTDPGQQAHQIMTTGAVTVPKVIPRSAGIKSIFHHVLGATLVEFDDDGDIFCRQLNAEPDGSFQDLDVIVRDDKILSGQKVRSIVFGDLHHAKLNERDALASFGLASNGRLTPGSILEALAPNLIFLHDVHDQEVGNHHRAGDGHFSARLWARGRGSMKAEIESLGDYLVGLWARIGRIVVVESNHDIALNRYIKEGRYRNDPPNIVFGAELELAMLQAEERVARALDQGLAPPSFSPLEHALRAGYGRGLDHVEWAYDGNSFLVDGIECGHHGFRGANGSQGTVKGFAKLGRKMSIGDKHSPAILDGVYCAGVMELQHGYNRGPSGWCVTHIVQYANSKRTLVTLQNGKWRA